MLVTKRIQGLNRKIENLERLNTQRVGFAFNAIVIDKGFDTGTVAIVKADPSAADAAEGFWIAHITEHHPSEGQVSVRWFTCLTARGDPSGPAAQRRYGYVPTHKTDRVPMEALQVPLKPSPWRKQKARVLQLTTKAAEVLHWWLHAKRILEEDSSSDEEGQGHC